ncbi:MAG: LytTR family DNA-binding domain-containing protein [Spirochaetaceae bacterium]|nr:LytTR family DNA-binding domain-containing protein [Spirochaetaceae bacterium]
MDTEMNAPRVTTGTSVQPAMPHGYREALSPHLIGVNVATSAAFAFILALFGPAGSFDLLTLPERLAFNTLYSLVCWPMYYAQLVVALYLFRFRRPTVIVVALAVTTTYMSFPASTVVFAVKSLTHPTYTAKIGLLNMYCLTAASSVAWSTLSWYLVWQRVRHLDAAIRNEGAGRGLPTDVREQSGAESNGEGATEFAPSGSSAASPSVGAEEESAAGRDGSAISGASHAAPAAGQVHVDVRPTVLQHSGEQPDALLRLLPGRLGRDLVYIKSEDHYIEVHTTVGSSLVKMRFSDAVAELGDSGIQVHRSYWVATRHVIKSIRSGRRTLLRLTGDHKVPVSVTHRPAVRTLLAR